MTLDLPTIRSHFPALQRPAIFFDNPGGTQVAQESLNQMTAYLVQNNANHGGAFETSQASDAIIEQARLAMADFLNASQTEEIVFGPNMTSLTFQVSRSIARTLNRGDQIVVTRLDHDANISPWTLIAEERGCKVRWVDFNTEDGTLNMESVQQALDGKPRLAAFGYASNALGTINPVEQMVRMAHGAGALVYVDAVQYAPHGLIDVQQLGCDYLVCSAYKFFGPHVGVLYGRYDLLERLFAYRVRPAPADPPGKFETGTLNHEGIAGALGAIQYLEWLGETYGGSFSARLANRYSGRRLQLKQAMSAIRQNEYEISRALIQVLKGVPGIRIYGIDDEKRVQERVPTFSFNLKKHHPREVAEELGQKGIYLWDGNYYALAITERLGLEQSGGMVRVGAVHYNTLEEVRRFGEALRKLPPDAERSAGARRQVVIGDGN
ncbi:MAG: cysteine desulfurase-like protein [Omnitrophica WOR_2 bacterium]